MSFSYNEHKKIVFLCVRNEFKYKKTDSNIRIFLEIIAFNIFFVGIWEFYYERE